MCWHGWLTPPALPFYEAPHRLLKTLEVLEGVVGGQRKIAVCKELTKKHEKALHFTMEEALAFYTENPPRGEFVLVLDGADEEKLREEKTGSVEGNSADRAYAAVS